MDEALSMARRLDRPFDLVLTLDWAFDIARYLRQLQVAQTLVAELAVLTAQSSFSHYAATDLI